MGGATRSMARAKILIATGEAATWQDYCAAAFLTQAGVPNDYVCLPEVGSATGTCKCS